MIVFQQNNSSSDKIDICMKKLVLSDLFTFDATKRMWRHSLMNWLTVFVH